MWGPGSRAVNQGLLTGIASTERQPQRLADLPPTHDGGRVVADLQLPASALLLQKGLAVGLLMTAAFTDLMRRRIYRTWSAVALISGLVLILLNGRWQHVLIAVSLFALTYVLWSNGGIGGGDIWLATYLGLALGIDAFLAMLISGYFVTRFFYV